MITSSDNLNVDSLASQADQLALVAEELSKTLDELRELYLRSPGEATSSEAAIATRPSYLSGVNCPEEVFAERQQLIEAWTALEAEQRKQAITRQPAPGRTTTNSPPHELNEDNSDTGGRSNVAPATLDFAQQFRFLQRECDRNRNS